MKLIGNMVIEMIDDATGEVVERVQEENMVTNAVNHILGLNPMGIFYSVAGEYDTHLLWNDNLLPICPIIDASGGGVSVTAYGCEKYLKLLRYGQYGQVGADGVWRDKNVDAPKGDTLEHSAVKVDISIELLAKLREYLREPRSRVELQKFCEIKSRDHFRNKILIPLIDSKKIKLTIPDKPTSSKQKYVWNDN